MSPYNFNNEIYIRRKKCKQPTKKKVKQKTTPSSLSISTLAATQFLLLISESTMAGCAEKSMHFVKSD
jgi:hypothetical protein